MNKLELTICVNCFLVLVENPKLNDALKFAFAQTNTEYSKKEFETFKRYYHRYRIANKMPLMYKKTFQKPLAQTSFLK